MTAARTLIVNADDFGRSAGINAGIMRAHLEGLVTSTSLMVRWPAAATAAQLARGCPRMSLGLHLDLGESAFRDGEWRAVYEVVDATDAQAVEREARAQLERFRVLVGVDPTHVDSHQHVHRGGAVAAVVDELARPLGLPVRDRHPRIAYRGDFYGRTGTGDLLHDAITVDSLLALLRGLAPGITELGCHPGENDGADPLYAEERELELRALCDARVRRVVRELGIALCSFAEVRAGL